MIAGGADRVMPRKGLPVSVVAWSIGIFSAVLLIFAILYWFWHGILQPIHLGYVTAIATGLVGALVASQHPRNVIGWWMLVAALFGGISTVPFNYGYSALHDHSGLPFGAFALWLASWMWIPTVGLGYGWILARFPDGRLPRGWRFVDWLAGAGTALLIIGIAFAPGPLYPSFLIDNPYGVSPARASLATALAVGLGLIAAAALAAYGSVAVRYHSADAHVRQQLKWILLATSIVTLALVYGAVLKVVVGANFTAALTPFAVALPLVPAGIGIAMHRGKLFDVDLVINRTLVYVTITAILGGLYVAGIELSQRLFVFYTGSTSETAIVITAFVVATVFTPVQKWVEGFVERRLGGRDAAGRLNALSSNVETIIRVIDPHRIARWIVEESVRAFDADGAALYLEADDTTQPFHVVGNLTGHPALEVAVRHGQQTLGRLLLGHRRNSPYSERDRAAVQRSADVLGEALSVADDLGHAPHG